MVLKNHQWACSFWQRQMANSLKHLLQAAANSSIGKTLGRVRHVIIALAICHAPISPQVIGASLGNPVSFQ